MLLCKNPQNFIDGKKAVCYRDVMLAMKHQPTFTANTGGAGRSAKKEPPALRPRTEKMDALVKRVSFSAKFSFEAVATAMHEAVSTASV